MKNEKKSGIEEVAESLKKFNWLLSNGQVIFIIKDEKPVEHIFVDGVLYPVDEAHKLQRKEIQRLHNELAETKDEVRRLNAVIEKREKKPSTKYDWSKAPKYATHAVRNRDGKSYWWFSFSGRFISDEEYGAWQLRGAGNDQWKEMDKSCILDDSCDWKDSLEARPE